MPRLRVLSGKEIIRILEQYGFQVIDQNGSHIQLENFLTSGGSRKITVPNHKSIPKGTLLAIYKRALESVPEDELKSYFYSD